MRFDGEKWVEVPPEQYDEVLNDLPELDQRRARKWLTRDDNRG